MTEDNLRVATNKCVAILKKAKLRWIIEITSKDGSESIMTATCSNGDALRAIGRIANRFKLNLRHIKMSIKETSEDFNGDTNDKDSNKRIDQIIE